MTEPTFPIGCHVKLLIHPPAGGAPEVMSARVVTGEITQGVLPCLFVARITEEGEDMRYVRVGALAEVNSAEEYVAELRRKWATEFLALCASGGDFSMTRANEAEAILRGEP